jgi:hypothetical protein
MRDSSPLLIQPNFPSPRTCVRDRVLTSFALYPRRSQTLSNAEERRTETKTETTRLVGVVGAGVLGGLRRDTIRQLARACREHRTAPDHLQDLARRPRRLPGPHARRGWKNAGIPPLNGRLAVDPEIGTTGVSSLTEQIMCSA